MNHRKSNATIGRYHKNTKNKVTLETTESTAFYAALVEDIY